MLFLILLGSASVLGAKEFIELTPCCLEKTAVCEACLANQTPEEWCKENPLEKTCYAAPGGVCGSCFCPPFFKQPFPNECDSNHECTPDEFLPDLPMRCTPILRKLGEDCGSCFCPPLFNAGSCEKGLHCVSNPSLPDLPGKCVAGKCCNADTAKCIACRGGFTEAQWCKSHPKWLGCPGGEKCCNEFKAECRACRGNLSVAEFCGLKGNSVFPGCERLGNFFLKERLQG